MLIGRKELLSFAVILLLLGGGIGFYASGGPSPNPPNSQIGGVWTGTDLYPTGHIYLGAGGTDVNPILEYPEQSASYIVWVDGGTYYAKNGHTGAVTSNANIATLVNGLTTALEALTPSGGKIHFKSGYYLFSSNFNLISNLCLEGDSDGSSQLYFSGTSCLRIHNKTDVTVQNIAIWSDANTDTLVKITNSTFNIVFFNVMFREGTNQVLLDTINDECLFLNCNFWYCTTTAVLSYYSHGAVFERCNFIGVSNASGTGISLYDSTNTRISHGLFTLFATGVDTHAFGGYNIEKTIIDSNYFEDLGRPISLRGNNELVTKNRFYDIVNNAIVAEGNYTQITYNEFDTSGSDHIWVLGTFPQIIGNWVKNGNLLTSNDPTYVVHYNPGYVSEISGTSAVASGATTSVVAHGLSYTPTAANTAWTITPTEVSTNDAGPFAVTMMNATHVTFSVLRNPGASNLDFSWAAKRVP